jgi:chromosome partitioning protein
MKNHAPSPYVFVVGNTKGGAGKTTCCMHLISGLMDAGLRVASIDTDVHQHSLTTYIKNRENYNKKQNHQQLSVPEHFLISPNFEETELIRSKQKEEIQNIISNLQSKVDVIVIDTPASICSLSALAHSYADTIVTPINDSFLDIDLLAKVDPDSFKINGLSTYSEMVWKQKLVRAQRDGGQIEWVVLRNRLSNIDAKNKRAVAEVIDGIAKRIKCKIAPGFSERVIFRELFLQGITLIDLANIETKQLTMSHLAAKQELRGLLSFLKIEQIKHSASQKIS